MAIFESEWENILSNRELAQQMLTELLARVDESILPAECDQGENKKLVCIAQIVMLLDYYGYRFPEENTIEDLNRDNVSPFFPEDVTEDEQDRAIEKMKEFQPEIWSNDQCVMHFKEILLEAYTATTGI